MEKEQDLESDNLGSVLFLSLRNFLIWASKLNLHFPW